MFVLAIACAVTPSSVLIGLLFEHGPDAYKNSRTALMILQMLPYCLSGTILVSLVGYLVYTLPPASPPAPPAAAKSQEAKKER
eukprot:tig00021357_g20767.t1